MGVESSPNPRSDTRAARSKRAPSAVTTATATPATPIDQDLRRALIAKAAYYRAEHRGFGAGCEADDWLAAEMEVDTALTLGAIASSS
jgi:Protein of unknown function (DUF2934)